MVHGLDQFFTGMNTLITGKPRITATEQVLQKVGMPPEWASFTNNLLSIGGITSAIGIARNGIYLATSSPLKINSINQELVWSRGAENINSAAALRPKLSGLQKAQGSAVQIRNLPDGRIRYYSLEVSASKQGLTRGTSYVRVHGGWGVSWEMGDGHSLRCPASPTP